MADDDYETEHPSVGAMIVREYNDHPSNFRSTATLGEVMKRWDIPGVWGVDTRKLTRSIRDLGSRKVMITGVETETGEALKRLREYEIPADAVSKVSCPQVRVFPAEHEKFRVAAIDCGMKKSMIDSMNRRGLTVTVVPWNTTAEAIEDCLLYTSSADCRRPVRKSRRTGTDAPDTPRGPWWGRGRSLRIWD